jgi:hypothetical protein
MHGSLAYQSSSAKLQNPEESQHLDDEFLTREKQANVLHLRRQASFTFLFPARSLARCLCLSLAGARSVARSLSLSLSRGALLLSRSVCRPQILRRASKELPAFLKELRTTPRLPNLLNYYSRSKRYLFTPTTLFVPAFFLLAPNFANMGNFFEAATHSMAFFSSY